jgi:AcrR family transcriptional regulator
MAKPPHDHLSRWERRKERTRRRLLAAADVLLREKGFDATTVEEIAAGADVAKGTFFNYFDSKEALLFHLTAARLEEALEELPAPGAPASERIHLTLELVRETLDPYRHLMRRMIPGHVKPPHRRDRPLVSALANLIREGQAQGAFRPSADADLAALFLAGYFYRLCLLGHNGDDADPSGDWGEHLERGMDLLYHGLLPCSPEGK